MEYCRLCLSQNFNGENMFNIFYHNNLFKIEEEDQLNTKNIRSILHKYCWFLILEPDDHSHQICKQCWNIVKEFHRFTIQIKNAQNKLFNINETTSNFDFPSQENQINIIENVKVEEDEISYDIITETTEDIPNLNKCKIKKGRPTNIEFVSPRTGNTKNGQRNLYEEEEIINEYFNLNCEVCLEKLPNVSSLFAHYGKSHKLRGYLRCCGKKIKRCDALDHVALHKNPEAFKCEFCHKNYQCSNSLNIHLKQHDAKFEPYQCEQCPRSFMKQDSLKAHIRFVHNENGQHIDHDNTNDGNLLTLTANIDFPCKFCDKIFSNELQLKRHRHRNISSAICDICAKVCASESGLRIHHIAAHSVGNLRVQCTECQRWFKNEETRRVHARRHKIELHTCDICKKEFSNIIMFKQHKRRSHVPLRHSCNLCNKTFGVPEALRKHMKRHTGQLLKCPFCTNILETKYGLEHHLKKWHQNEVENQII